MLFWAEVTYMEEEETDDNALEVGANATSEEKLISNIDSFGNLQSPDEKALNEAKEEKKIKWRWSYTAHKKNVEDLSESMDKLKAATGTEPPPQDIELNDVSSGNVTRLKGSIGSNERKKISARGSTYQRAKSFAIKGGREVRRRGTAFENEWTENMKNYNDDINLGFSRSLVIAMSHYDMEFYKVFHEAISETRVIVAWGSNGQIVVSFRGTVKLPNMLNDIMCLQTTWRSMVPASQAKAMNRCEAFCRRPMIHHGFKRAMASENVGSDLVTFISYLIHDLVRTHGVRPCIRITGHSLGGALATLMSYEILVRCKDVNLTGREINVYTFGCPGLCNTVAQKLYEDEIPTIFHVINDVDFIAYCGPWLRFFKPGIIVLINKYGDLIVRPSIIESSLHHIWFQEKLKDHFLSAYRQSVAKICESDPECSTETVETILDANPLMRSNFENLNLVKNSKTSRFQKLAFLEEHPAGRVVAKPFKLFGAGIVAIGSAGDYSVKKIKHRFRRQTLYASDSLDESESFDKYNTKKKDEKDDDEEDGWEGDVEDNRNQRIYDAFSDDSDQEGHIQINEIV